MNNNNKTFLIQEATPDQQIQKIPCTNFFPEFLSGGVVAVFVINLQHIVLHHLSNLQLPIKAFPGIVFWVLGAFNFKEMPKQVDQNSCKASLTKGYGFTIFLQYFFH